MNVENPKLRDGHARHRKNKLHSHCRISKKDNCTKIFFLLHKNKIRLHIYKNI